MRIVINEIPKSPNGKSGTIRMNWWKRPAYRRYWHGLVRAAIDNSHNPCNQRMRVVISQMRRRKLDRDNLWASNKIVLDALTAWKLIKDDSEKWIELDCTQVVGKEKWTIITIENVVELEAGVEQLGLRAMGMGA